MRLPLFCCLWLLTSFVPCARATSVITQPFAGVRYTQRTQTVPRPLNLHIVEIDLTHPAIRCLISPGNGTARGENNFQTVRAFTTASGAQLAVNASFFLTSSAGANLDNRGIVSSRGDVYSPFDGDNRPWPVLNISEGNFARILSQAIQPSTDTATIPDIPLYNAVSGSERVVTNGRNTAGTVSFGEPTTLQPRTAAGITADRSLVLLVADGRNTGVSEGLLGSETANLLIQYGVVDAINLDGGGSSTLVVANPTPRVMNRPSDGSERSVGAILAIFAAAAPAPRDVAVFADFFAGDHEGFSSALGADSTGSLGILTSSTASTLATQQAFARGWHQRLAINDDAAISATPESPSGGWFVRHPWTPTNASRLTRPTRGHLGYWVRTAVSGIQVAVSVNTSEGVVRSVARPLPADGRWHLVQWDLTGPAEWTTAVTAPTFTLDSLLFFGPNADAIIDLDLVSHNALGSLADEFAPPEDGRLANASIRAAVTAGDPALTIGLTIEPSSPPKPLLIRAIGPTLTSFGINGALTDPFLTVTDTRGAVLATNDNWAGTTAVASTGALVGAFPFPSVYSLDAAAVVSLTGGGYLAAITTPSGATGAALIESYDATTPLAPGTPRFLNVSARARSGHDADPLIAGFVISGGTKRILIRAVGPGLTPLGITDVLPNPSLSVYTGSTLHAINDDWGGGPVLTDTFARTGAFALPAAGRDAALLLTLAPGAYSAHVGGAPGTSGLVLLEIYEVP